MPASIFHCPFHLIAPEYRLFDETLSYPQEREDAEAEDRRKRGLAAAGHCDACGKVLVAKKAFSRFEFRYCSSDCANLHKRKLAADAAERRFNAT